MFRRIFHEDDEFISAQSSDDLIGKSIDHHVGEAVEDLVSDNMSELIVNTLKVVDVDDHVGCLCSLSQAHFDLLGQIRAVPKSRHRVLGGDALEPLGTLLGKSTEFLKFECTGYAATHDFRDKRLTDKVSRTEFEAFDLCLRVCLRRKEDNRDLVEIMYGTDLSECLQAVHLRHIDIQKDQIRHTFLQKT